MKSRLSGHLKHILAAQLVLALVVIAVVGSQERGEPTATDPIAATAAQQADDCTGQCAGCPNAKVEGDPVDATDESAAESTEDASVDTEKCIACVRCVNVAPEAFRMNPDTGKAEVIEGASAEDIARCAQACPVHAVIQ